MESKERFPFLRQLPLLWISLAFLVGIPLAFLIALAPFAWAALTLLAGALAFFAHTRKQNWNLWFAFALLFSLLAGALRYSIAQSRFDFSDLAFHNDRSEIVEITGIIIKPPVTRDKYVEMIVRAEQIAFSSDSRLPVGGTVLARVIYSNQLAYGDRIILRGELTTSLIFEDLSYRDYLARQGIHSQMPLAAADRIASGQGNPLWAALYALRSRSLQTIYRIYPDPEASLFAGILLGEESGISDRLKIAFNNTGTRHIVAISGFNISIIAGLFLATLTRWLGIRRGIWLAATGVVLYTLLVGAEASVVRAAIMGVIALAARQVGRQQFALNTLAFSAGLMALINPLVIWDVGFQLSFAATLGLILFADPMEQGLDAILAKRVSKETQNRVSGPIYEYFLLTTAAQITTLPLLLYHFERFSFVSLPANMLILWAQPAVMIVGGFSVIFGLVSTTLGQLIGFIGWPFAAYTIRIVEILAPLASAPQAIHSVSPLAVAAYYVLIAILATPVLRKRVALPQIRPAYTLVALGAASVLIWNSALQTPDGLLRLTLLDVDGEALLIETPDGRRILINTGPSANQLAAALGRELPLFDRDVDWLIIAGLGDDQAGALPAAFERLAFDQVAWAGSVTNARIKTLESVLSDRKGLIYLHPGDEFDLGDGAQLEILSSGTRGATLLLEWDEFSALLPLGLDFDQLDGLIASPHIQPVDLLVLPDSGYTPLNPPSLFLKLAPTVIWIAGDVQPIDEAFLPTGLTVLRADQNGWLNVATDGQSMWLGSEH
ncbi:MAG: ComEC/Rec2 family competence protein [Anaerolineales bacterium]